MKKNISLHQTSSDIESLIFFSINKYFVSFMPILKQNKNYFKIYTISLCMKFKKIRIIIKIRVTNLNEFKFWKLRITYNILYEIISIL